MYVRAKMEYVLKEGGTFQEKVIPREAEGRQMGTPGKMVGSL